MPLTIGDKLGPYEILASVGAGGMGEVFKARDTRLDRIVAIKISKQEFSERFEREARAIAALNHPRVCQLYDVGPNYLVFEFVEGDRLKGPLPLDKALDYAAQICDALDAAHSKKITHRDLKPANIMVTKQGVKLLDFGLAKIDAPLKDAAETVTMGLTGAGQILGTLLYMAPEQLQAKEADSRSDIFAFGCVLYEMLTGKRAFDGQNPASIIAAILERPAPSIAAIAPPALDGVLKKCLEKDPEARWQSARDLKSALDLVVMPATARSEPRASASTHLPWAIAALLGLAAASSVFLQLRQAQPSESATVRFEISAPAKSEIEHFALSPNGSMLAFSSGGRMWVRSLDALQARALEGTEGAQTMFWSPDSQFLAFVAQGKLKKVPATGGPVQVLCDASQGYGGTWNRNGTILFSASLDLGLFRIPEGGGTPVSVSTHGDLGRNVPSIKPQFLPDGNHFLYSSLGATSAIYAGSLDGASPVPVANSRYSTYVPTVGARGSDGYLVFEQNRQLLAQRFDAARLKVGGDAVPVADDLRPGVLWPNFSASENGTLVFARAGASSVQLVWVDRTGKQVGVFAPSGVYDSYRISSDDKRIAFVDRTEANTDIWVFDSARGVRSRFTFDPAIDDPPMWSPDGLQIVWASNRGGGGFDLYRKAANGVGEEKLLVKMGTQNGWAEDWSRDGRYIIYQIPGAKTGQDLWIAPQATNGAGETPKPFPYLQSAFDEEHGRFSPDARWIAYTSNETGRPEVYIQSFPTPGTKLQISSNGGREPHWRKDGAELFYIGEDRMLTAVPIKLSGSASEPLQAGPSKSLFVLPFVNNFIVNWSYDVSNDGQRFLVPVLPIGASAPPLNVILNWQSSLKR